MGIGSVLLSAVRKGVAGQVTHILRSLSSYPERTWNTHDLLPTAQAHGNWFLVFSPLPVADVRGKQVTRGWRLVPYVTGRSALRIGRFLLPVRLESHYVKPTSRVEQIEPLTYGFLLQLEKRLPDLNGINKMAQAVVTRQYPFTNGTRPDSS
jgi:hypothetical protein